MTALSKFVALSLLSFSPHIVRANPPPSRVVEWGMDLISQREPAAPVGTSTGVVATAGQVLSDAVAVAAGSSHGLALRSDGTVLGWGWNFYGQAAGLKSLDPDVTNSLVAIAGRVLSNVTAIAAGRTHSLALKNDGTVVAWGADENEKPAHVPTGLSNVVAIASGWNYSLALKKDGTVTSWGERKVPAGLSNVVAITTGGGYYGFGLALKKDGTVFEWGPGGLEDPAPSGLSNVTAISAGGGHCLALKADGTVVGWGDNHSGEATGVATTNFPSTSRGPVTVAGRVLSNVVAIAAGSRYSLALKRDGSVVSWGSNPWRTTNVPAGVSNVVAIAAGENFCLAITTNSSFSAVSK